MSFVLFDATSVSASPYLLELKRTFPDRPVQLWSSGISEPQQIEYALVWDPPAELFKVCSGLKAVFNLGAGVDQLMRSNLVPEQVPIIRLIDPMLGQGMAEYVTWAVLRYHRQLHLYSAAQQENNWIRFAATDARQTRVSMLGLGELALSCCQALGSFGFQLMGWSRSEKSLPGVNAYVGESGLTEMLGRTDILVCLLPLTRETRHILNADLFHKLPSGAKLVAVGRGEHLLMADLISALESDQLSHVTLDVFPEEPLPKSHPLWSHPKVTITPHIASQTLPASAIEVIARNVQILEQGGMPDGLVRRDQGY